MQRSLGERTSPVNVYIVMGVSGCGKSSVAQLLASRTGGIFLDGDDFHPPENKAKMEAGIPLNDEDRWGWLDILNAELKQRSEEQVFLACSALRQVYRNRLIAGIAFARFICLRGSKELIAARLNARKGHFMPAALLESQFGILEEPGDALVLDIDQDLQDLVGSALKALRL